MPAVRDWDGSVYDRISGPMQNLGMRVLDRLELCGDEVILDAGCGSGRITQQLIARVPEGRVIGMDLSESMIGAARRRLGGDVDLRVGDLLELDLGEPLDAIFSTATFHWIGDHDRLFASLRGALKDGGQLVAQCGGEGNITILRGAVAHLTERPPYAPHFADFKAPWNYASAEITQQRLLAAGFSSARCWLAPAPTQPEDPREFLSSIVLGPHVQQLPEDLREQFMDDVLEVLPEPVIVDYVRLNIDALA